MTDRRNTYQQHERARRLRHEDRKIREREHFIVQGIRYSAPYYLLFWVLGIIFAIVCTPFLAPVVNYDYTRFFAGSTLTISITTITLALPTALNIVLERYSKYTNRNIINILVQRFPISVLTLSAFTSLIISLAVASGFLGNYFSPTGETTIAFALLIMIFWAVVCIIYLFIVIEKMVYFVVRAPEAVLDKLEFGVFSALDLGNKEQYADFRSQLASINDIAATLVEQSTGRDVVFIRCLDALRTIHKLYLTKGVPETDTEKRKLDFKAVHAVDQEIIRIYRAAANAKNEHATLSIVNTWCLMLRDAVRVNADNLYIAEMMNQIQRFQSYAETAFVEVIEEQVYTDWYFLLSGQLQDITGPVMPYTRIAVVRELSAALRRVTINQEENLFLRFMRVASNSDLDINLEGLNRIWLNLLDRAVLVYLTWLLSNEPRDCAVYLNYLRAFSAKRTNWMRSILTDTPARLEELLQLTVMADSMEASQSDRDAQILRTNAEEMEEAVRSNPVSKPGEHAVTIIDDAEDINVGQEQTVSVVTKLVENADLPTISALDEATRKEMQTLTSNIAEDDPRVLGGTAAMMGLPIDIYEEETMDPGRVLAFLVQFSYAGADMDAMKAKYPLVRKALDSARELRTAAEQDAELAHKIELAQRCAAQDIFAVL